VRVFFEHPLKLAAESRECIPHGFGAVFDGKIRTECFFWSPNGRRAQVSFRETH